MPVTIEVSEERERLRKIGACRGVLWVCLLSCFVLGGWMISDGRTGFLEVASKSKVLLLIFLKIIKICDSLTDN